MVQERRWNLWMASFSILAWPDSSAEEALDSSAVSMLDCITCEI